jgi:hypothetical protein
MRSARGHAGLRPSMCSPLELDRRQADDQAGHPGRVPQPSPRRRARVVRARCRGIVIGSVPKALRQRSDVLPAWSIQHVGYAGTQRSDVGYCLPRDGRGDLRCAFLFPGPRLLELMTAAHRSTRSRAGYVIPADMGEHIQVGIGLPGWWGQQRHATVAREAMPKFVRSSPSPLNSVRRGIPTAQPPARQPRYLPDWSTPST